MKRTVIKSCAAVLGTAMLAAIAACDGGSTPSATTVTPKPPPPPDQRVQAPRPPSLGGESFQKTDKPPS